MSTLAVLMASIFFFQFATTQHHSRPHESLTEIVDSLGYHGGGNAEGKLEILSRSSPDTVFPLLIGQLSLITDATEMSEFALDSLERDSHIIWCIRALRYLTDSTMSATTTYTFGKNEDVRTNMLAASRRGRVRFFGEWMSRAWIFIAPLDAQKTIIEEWKNWYSQNRTRLRYHLAKAGDEWYF